MWREYQAKTQVVFKPKPKLKLFYLFGPQHFDEIEKIMRECEDGGEKGDECKMLEEVCPAVKEQRFDEITAICMEAGKY